VIAQADEPRVAAARALLVPVMQHGERLPAGRETLDTIRARTKADIDRLPEYLRQLTPLATPYPVEISAALARAHRDLIAQMTA
jgi:hypothetical protein